MADGALRRLDDTGLPQLAARLVVGVLFVALGWSKLDDPVAFLKALREYEMFPPGAPWLMNATAGALPLAEVLCGALLLLGVAVRGTALFLGAMLVAFTLAIGLRTAALSAQDAVPLCAVAFDCGCGKGVQNGCSKLAENAGLLLACAVALASRSRRWCLRPALLRAG